MQRVPAELNEISEEHGGRKEVSRGRIERNAERLSSEELKRDKLK